MTDTIPQVINKYDKKILTKFDLTTILENNATIDYVDQEISKQLSLNGERTMQGQLDMGNNQVKNLKDPESSQDAATKNYIDTKTDYTYQQIKNFNEGVKLNTIDQLNVPINDVNMNNKQFINVKEPLLHHNVATKNYVDTKKDYLYSQIRDFNEGVKLNRLNELQQPDTDVYMNNNYLKSLKDPSQAQDAATKNYVDTKNDYKAYQINDLKNTVTQYRLDDFTVPISSVDFNNQVLKNVADPVASQDVVNRKYVDTKNDYTYQQIQNFNQGVLQFRLDQFLKPMKQINMNSNTLYNVAEPINPSEAATKNYVDTKQDYTYQQIGNFTEGVRENTLNDLSLPYDNLNMNNYRIINVDNPLDAKDAVNKQWLFYHINDIAMAIGPKNIQGNEVSGVDGLTIKKEVGMIFKKNIGTQKNPHIKELPEFNTANSQTFKYIYYNTKSVESLLPQTQLNPLLYDNLQDENAQIVPDEQPWTIQCIWVNEDNEMVVSPGQNTYDSIQEAKVNFNNGNIKYNTLLDNYVLLAAVIIKKQCIDLTELFEDQDQATYEFQQVSKYGMIGSVNSQGLDLDQFVNIDGSISMQNDLNMGGNRLKNVSLPQLSSDAATKQYVDTKKTYTYSQIHDFNIGVQQNSITDLQLPNSSIDMQGYSIKNVQEPVVPNDVATKNYVDTKYDYKVKQVTDFSDGVKSHRLDQLQPAQQFINMNNNKIINVANPSNSTDVVNKNYVDTKQNYSYKQISDFDLGVQLNYLDSLKAPQNNIDFNNNNITNLADPVNPQDGVTKNYVDTKSNYSYKQVSDFYEGVYKTKVNQLQKPSANLDMNYNRIELVSNPVQDSDAATKNYVDNKNDFSYKQVQDFEQGVHLQSLTQLQPPTSNINVNNNQLNNVADPIVKNDAATKNYVDTKQDYRYQQVVNFNEGVQLNRLDQLSKPTLSVDMNNHKVLNLDTPVNPLDAVNKQYVDNKQDFTSSQIQDFDNAVKLNRVDLLKAPQQPFNLNNQKIINLKNPENNQDVVNKQWLDYNISNLADVMGPSNISGNDLLGINNSLKFKKTAGSIFKKNCGKTEQQPHVVELAEVDLGGVGTFKYISVKDGQVSQLRNTLIPNKWDDCIQSMDQLPAVPAGKFTIQRVWLNQDNELYVQFGQNLFDSLAEAKLNLDIPTLQIPSKLNGFIQLGYIIMSANCTNINDANKAVILYSTKYGIRGLVNTSGFDLDTLLKVDGQSVMSGSLQMGQNYIKNVKNPIQPQDAATKDYVDNKHTYSYQQIQDFNNGVQANKLNQMSKPDNSVDMNNQLLTNVKNPVSDKDAVNKQWVTREIDGILDLLCPINVYGNKVNSTHNLYIQKSLGYLMVKNSGNEESPHKKELKAFDSSVSDTFQYIFKDGLTKFNMQKIDPTLFDGEDTPDIANYWTIQRLWVNESGDVVVSPGQVFYVNRAQAIINMNLDLFERNDVFNDYLLLSFILVENTCTDLSDKTKAQIIPFKPFNR